MQINKIFFQILFVIIGLALISACQSSAGKTAVTTAGGSANTPTEAYKSLYGAVKSKNIEDIKANMSKETIAFVESVSGMQQKQPAEVFKNGLTETTFAEKLPPMRNERVKENMGALEVQSTKGNWEDLPFVLEDGRWKLAVGDLFKNTYKKPAPSQAETEANNNVPQVIPAPANMNTAVPVKPGGEMKPEKPSEKQKDAKANEAKP
jgi:hypothetical protein